MGYNKRKFEIIKEFLSPNLFLDIRKLLKNKNNDSSQIKDLEREFGEKLRNLFENLGPVFVKFGQLLSTRRDIFSENISCLNVRNIKFFNNSFSLSSFTCSRRS